MTWEMVLAPAAFIWSGWLIAISTLLLLAALLLIAFLVATRWTSRWVLYLATRIMYRIRMHGMQNVPSVGGALLVSNHVTWVDGVLLLGNLPRHARMIIYSDYSKGGVLGWLMERNGVIPINRTEGPKSILRSLQTARDLALSGELVCIFAEGQLTRLGQLLPFQRGVMKIVDGTDIPVIPVYLDGLWGSIFSFFQGKYFWKWPQKWPYPIGISFGKPIHSPESVHQIQQAVAALGVESLELRKNVDLTLPRRFIRASRRALRRVKLADSSGQQVTGGQLLIRSLILRRLLSQKIAANERYVGVLLPPSVGGALTNAALALMSRVVVNLNYTASREIIESCLKQAGVRRVLTNRQFLAKIKLELPQNVEVVFVEDLRGEV
ncbi:MAG: 1-acyl-sn-glycerol-3-phosphate acyltransferase, partial [Planctomycetaceae bacterium]